MKVAVVGGGVLGLALGHRLAKNGHSVSIFEGAPNIGGLAAGQNYGEFVWDRFYHCILPQDANLLALLGELGLSGEFRWRTTRTGYFAKGRFHSMSGNRDFLRFPLLSLLDKTRLGAAIIYATRFADPFKLYHVTAADWLRKICGKRTYEVFWRPLLKAKLGSRHEEVAAVFIWATLKRLFGARTGTAQKEKLGYVKGGYARILGRMVEVLTELGAEVRVRAPVTSISTAPGGIGGQKLCRVTFEHGDAGPSAELFDQVFFTAPARLAKKVVSPDLLPHVERTERTYPTSHAYLGVACLTLVLKSPLTPYYVLNIGDESVEMTGLIEMTNLVDRSDTAGRSLVYLPRYMDSEDPMLDASDAQLEGPLFERGLRRLFPKFTEDQIVYGGIHRAKLVQPLPLVSQSVSKTDGVPEIESPFQMVGTFMLQAATLNNNEVVGLVEELMKKNAARLEPAPGARRKVTLELSA